MVDVLNTARLRHERRRTNLLRSAMPQTNAIFRKLGVARSDWKHLPSDFGSDCLP